MLSFHYKNTREDHKFAKQLRKAGSRVESKMWVALAALNKTTEFKFRRQYPIHPYVADFVCVKAKLVIEIDGASHDARQAQDAKRDTYLRERGWAVMRFGNEDVLQNVDGVMASILERLRQAGPARP